jgi:RNA polymerase-binding protein DksA
MPAKKKAAKKAAQKKAAAKKKVVKQAAPKKAAAKKKAVKKAAPKKAAVKKKAVKKAAPKKAAVKKKAVKKKAAPKKAVVKKAAVKKKAVKKAAPKKAVVTKAAPKKPAPKKKKSQLKKYGTYYSALSLKRKLLTEGLSKSKAEVQSHSGTDGIRDYADVAQRAYTKEFLYSLSAAERRLLQLVDAARSRIEDGEYGSCANCGKTVQVKRLNAIPWARHCIQCQELWDEGKLHD